MKATITRQDAGDIRDQNRGGIKTVIIKKYSNYRYQVINPITEVVVEEEPISEAGFLRFIEAEDSIMHDPNKSTDLKLDERMELVEDTIKAEGMDYDWSEFEFDILYSFEYKEFIVR